MCSHKTILPFYNKELKSYIQILKAKTGCQDQMLGKAVHWLELESKHSTETGMESTAEQSERLGLLDANGADHLKCIWQFQH